MSDTKLNENTKTQDSNSLNNSLNSNDKDKSSSNSINKNEIRFRENLYRLIISQLFYDGYQNIAVGLSGAIQVDKITI